MWYYVCDICIYDYDSIVIPANNIKQAQWQTTILAGFTWMYDLSFLGGLQDNMFKLLKYSSIRLFVNKAVFGFKPTHVTVYKVDWGPPTSTSPLWLIHDSPLSDDLTKLIIENGTFILDLAIKKRWFSSSPCSFTTGYLGIHMDQWIIHSAVLQCWNSRVGQQI